MARPATSHLVEGDSSLLRDINRPLPGDVTRVRKTPSKEVVKQRSFFEDAFSVRSGSAAQERVRSEAMVMAEVKTNVIISDEFTFITELSYHLSTRYQRPVSSIVVSVQHGACMLFGGTFDPAYTMTISALPAQLQPATNKRNAALIQRHMEETLKVSQARGVVRFSPISEDEMAINGKTMAGEIDDLENRHGSAQAEDTTSIVSRRSKTRRKMSVKSLGNFRSASAVNGSELTPPTSADDPPPLPTIPGTPESAVAPLPEKDPARGKEKEKTAKRKKSFVASIFGRSSNKSERRPSLPR